MSRSLFRSLSLILVAVAAVGFSWSTASAQTTSYHIFTDEVPVEIGSDGPYELGMKWTSTTSGTLIGTRFYRVPGEPKDGGESNVHWASVWDENGNLLARYDYGGANGRWLDEGWQQISFGGVGVPIEANKTYTISVNILSHYASTQGGLSSPVTNGPLSSISGSNGVYSTTVGAFPTNSWNDSNYFVDVWFVPDETTTPDPTGTYTILTNEVPADTDSDGPYELGMKWTSTHAGNLTQLRWYRALGEQKDGGEGAYHSLKLWDSSGNLIVSIPTAGINGYLLDEGWQTLNVNPIPIAANTTYTVSVNILSHYVSTQQGLANAITNGPLSSIGGGSNGVYSTTPGAFPTSSWNSSNYFLDVTVEY